MSGSVEDHSFVSDVATILVRETGPDTPWWLVTWLPNDENHPSYPGFTITSDEVPFPTTDGPLSAAEWVDRWAKETSAGLPPEARVLDVPANEWHGARQQAIDAGWEFFAWVEPDNRFSWAVEKDGITLKSGTANSWDDAKLDAIIDFPAPSGER